MKKFQSLGRTLSKDELKKIKGGDDTELTMDPGNGGGVIACGDKKCGGGDNLTWSLSCTDRTGSCSCPSNFASWDKCGK